MNCILLCKIYILATTHSYRNKKHWKDCTCPQKTLTFHAGLNFKRNYMVYYTDVIRAVNVLLFSD